MNQPMLKAIHETRRAIGIPGEPFDELTPDEIEALKAEVRAYVQDGAEPEPVLRAIVDALK